MCAKKSHVFEGDILQRTEITTMMQQLMQEHYGLINQEDEVELEVLDDEAGESLDNEQKQINYLKQNPKIVQLAENMINRVYPRLLQLLNDFQVDLLEVSEFVQSTFNCSINYKNQNLQFQFSYNSYLLTSNECPVLNNFHVLQSYTKDELLQNNLALSYINFCNTIIDVVDKLEQLDIGLNNTIQRAEKCTLRFDNKVIIEKWTKRF